MANAKSKSTPAQKELDAVKSAVAPAPAKPNVLGIEALKSFVSEVMNKLRLDKNKDGKVSKSEWISGILDLIPSFFNFDDVSAEARDLTTEEVKQIIDHVGKFFPDYAGVSNEVEALVREIVALVVQGFNVYQAAVAINKKV